MEKIGTNYGGWYVPIEAKLNNNSIIYSGGVGEDISFDLGLIDKYDCNIFLIDPTKKSKKHFKEYKKYVLNDQNYKFTGNIQPDYYDSIKNYSHNLDKIKYIDLGIWNKKTFLKFYRQSNNNYVSRSLIPNMFSNKYYKVKVDTLKNIMEKNNHSHIDLLKLDIEGAEINVLDNMINDHIFPKYLCIEFDLYRNRKDSNNKTLPLIDRLQKNDYIILKNDDFNITFEHKPKLTQLGGSRKLKSRKLKKFSYRHNFKTKIHKSK